MVEEGSSFMSSVQGVNTDTNSLSLINALSIPSGLSPAELGAAEQILAEAASGTITTAQAQAQLAALTSSQSQSTPQGSSQVTGAHHHGRHHEGSEETQGTQSQTLASVLNLSSEQQSEITSILKKAQSNGSTPEDVLSQITSVLTPAQQQTLANFGSQPPLFTTTA